MKEFTKLFACIADSIKKERLDLIMAKPLSGAKMEIPLAGRTISVNSRKDPSRRLLHSSIEARIDFLKES